jgi:hypothetical protein
MGELAKVEAPVPWPRDYVHETFWERVALHPCLDTLFVFGVIVLSACDPEGRKPREHNPTSPVRHLGYAHLSSSAVRLRLGK